MARSRLSWARSRPLRHCTPHSRTPLQLLRFFCARRPFAILPLPSLPAREYREWLLASPQCHRQASAPPLLACVCVDSCTCHELHCAHSATCRLHKRARWTHAVCVLPSLPSCITWPTLVARLCAPYSLPHLSACAPVCDFASCSSDSSARLALERTHCVHTAGRLATLGSAAERHNPCRSRRRRCQSARARCSYPARRHLARPRRRAARRRHRRRRSGWAKRTSLPNCAPS